MSQISDIFELRGMYTENYYYKYILQYDIVLTVVTLPSVFTFKIIITNTYNIHKMMLYL